MYDYIYIIYIYIYIYIYVIVILFWWSYVILSRNLDEVFTYNQIWLQCPFEAALMLKHPWF